MPIIGQHLPVVKPPAGTDGKSTTRIPRPFNDTHLVGRIRNVATIDMRSLQHGIVMVLKVGYLAILGQRM